MNPYDIDYKSMKESRIITDERELFRYRLAAEVTKIILKMETPDILEKTGLDKSDLSRLKCGNLKRFSIDRILGILNSLGFSAKVSIVRTHKAS